MSLIRKVYSKLFKQSTKPELPLDSFIKNGIVSIGDRNNIDSLVIEGYEFNKTSPNVIIGNDCYLQCKIVIHSKEVIVKIGNGVFIGPGTTLFCNHSINIENDVMISWGCTLIDTNAHSLKSSERKNDVSDWKRGWQYKNWAVVESKAITIKSNSWIGFNSIIMKGVEVGNGGVVAAGSVVSKNVDPYTIVGGNPAKFLKNTE
jgi:acetyltransferase-like isoleucine patch superfamily enzyme